MRKGVPAHDGLRRIRTDTDDGGQQLAAPVDLGGVHFGIGVVDVLAGLQRHDDLFQRRIAGPFADAVDGAFHLFGSRPDRCQGVAHGHAQVVVAVGG